MAEVKSEREFDTGICEMSLDEVDQVNGAGPKEAAAAFGLAGAIGTATYGSGWAMLSVGAAFGAAPIVGAAILGLALYGGYKIMMR
jgi:hypothetical protein